MSAITSSLLEPARAAKRERKRMPLLRYGNLEVLLLAGSPEEMGLEHGHLMRDRIQAAVRGFVLQSERAFGVPYRVLCEKAVECSCYIPERFKLELSSLAVASGESYEDLLALNCLIDVDGIYMQSLFRCCNFVACPPNTRDGLFMHGRNLDFPHFDIANKMAIVIVRHPAEEPLLPTLSVTWVGFVGTLTGCNGAGISLAEVGVPSTDASLEGVPIAFLLRNALEVGRNGEAVYSHLHKSKRTCGFNVLVADGNTQEAWGIEMTHSLCERRQTQHGFLVVDDVCLCRRTGRLRLTHAAGAFRHARMMQLLTNSTGNIDVPAAIGFLKDRYDMAYARPIGRGYACICNEHTVQSVLFLPSENRCFIAHGELPAPNGPYYELDLDEFWRLPASQGLP